MMKPMFPIRGSGTAAAPTVFVRVLLAAHVALAATASHAELTLTPVGSTHPGVGPVGLATAQTSERAYVFVGDYQGDAVRSLRLDRATGTLTPVGSVALPNGPSALAVTSDAAFVLATSLRGNSVTSLRFDPVTGGLAPIGSVPSGGTGPTAIAVGKHGYVFVANRDSNEVGMLRLNPSTGGLVPIRSVPVGVSPSTVAVADNAVFVGHAGTNDVHQLRLNPATGGLTPVGSGVVGARIVSMAVDSIDTAEAKPGAALERGTHRVHVATYPNGEVHEFRAGPRRLVPVGSFTTGGDLTSIAPDGRGGIFAAGAQPGRLAAFDLHVTGLTPTGTLALSGLSSRTIATVPGTEPGTTLVIVNEYNNNQTLVVRATRQ